MSAVGLVILAAGGSSRLGSPKQLLRFDGKSLLRRAAETAVASVCRPLVVVLGGSAERCLPELRDVAISIVQNTAWEEGMGSSIRIGVETLLAQTAEPLDALVLMVCDQPLLTSGVIDALVAEYRASRCLIAAAHYGDVASVPALFHHSLFPELMGLAGAHGAKQILQRYPEHIHKVAFPDGTLDIDTQADVARFGLS